MKQAPIHSIVAFFAISLLLFTACDDHRVQTVTWTEYEPVYMTQEEFIAAVGMSEPRDMEKPGKIYLFGDHLFVNEINKGVHIIDNSNPAAPHFVGFVTIPGNKDIAVRGDQLYADSAGDLLVFDISNFNNPVLISRIEDVFNLSQHNLPGPAFRMPDPSRGIVVDWEEVVIEEVCQGNCYGHAPSRWGWGGFFTTFGRASGDASGSTGSSGTGGSMARFAITGDYLYAVDWSNLVTFDITDPEPVKQNQQGVGWMIETIFPYNEHLFIGSANSMYIYDIHSNPSYPERVSVFRHATACDPVVVEGNYAYVTLRDGEHCPNITGNNQLEVIDVSDLFNPKRIGIYKMLHPHGLGIDSGDLFISEGDHGLKIMDASDPYNVKEVRHIDGIRTFDVIPNNGVLVVTGPTGIIQYDYTDVRNLKELSIILAGKTTYEPDK